MALIDTGPLVALLDPHDGRHVAAVRVLRNLLGPVTTTWAVMTEAMYLLGRGGGWHGQAPLAELVQSRGIAVADFSSALGRRTMTLMEAYADVPMDFADASLVALAEALQEFHIVTFDNDFRVYRAVGGQTLVVLDGSA